MLEVCDKIIKQLQITGIAYQPDHVISDKIYSKAGHIGTHASYSVLLRINTEAKNLDSLQKLGLNPRLDPKKLGADITVMKMIIEITQQKSTIIITSHLIGSTAEFDLADPNCFQQIKDYINKFISGFKKVHFLELAQLV